MTVTAVLSTYTDDNSGCKDFVSGHKSTLNIVQLEMLSDHQQMLAVQRFSVYTSSVMLSASARVPKCHMADDEFAHIFLRTNKILYEGTLMTTQDKVPRESLCSSVGLRSLRSNAKKNTRTQIAEVVVRQRCPVHILFESSLCRLSDFHTSFQF